MISGALRLKSTYASSRDRVAGATTLDAPLFAASEKVAYHKNGQLGFARLAD